MTLKILFFLVSILFATLVMAEDSIVINPQRESQHQRIFFAVSTQEIFKKHLHSKIDELSTAFHEASDFAHQIFQDLCMGQGSLIADRVIQALQSNMIPLEMMIEYIQHKDHIEKLIATTYNSQLRMKRVNGLLRGLYGYERNTFLALKYLGEMVAQGNEEAINMKIDLLQSVRTSHGENIKYARRLNEFLVAQGNQKALLRKIEGLLKGKHGYAIDDIQAFTLIKIISQKSLLSIHGNKFVRLMYCMYNHCLIERKKYNNFDRFQLRKTMHAFNKLLIQQGDETAIFRKLKGHMEGSYGYKKDPARACQFLEKLSNNQNSLAMKERIMALIHGFYGYSKKNSLADEHARIDEMIAQDCKAALEIKLDGLDHSAYGYEGYEGKAKEYLEALISEGNKTAIAIKMDCLATNIGVYGYKVDPHEALGWAFLKEFIHFYQ